MKRLREACCGQEILFVRGPEKSGEKWKSKAICRRTTTDLQGSNGKSGPCPIHHCSRMVTVSGKSTEKSKKKTPAGCLKTVFNRE
jgi:hypothetical protein